MIRLTRPPQTAASRKCTSPGAMAVHEALPPWLGPYRLLHPIGEGGMAVVHLAAGPDNRLVAIKVLRLPAAGGAEARRRLAREVKAMRRVHNPFVTEVTDADLTGEVPYVVTKFVPGRTLAQVVAGQGPLRGGALQHLAHGLAEALAAVHAAGIVHRDLKPGNVMMADGDPVLIDFGIAYQAGDAPLTQTGTYLGTPAYLAPEVIEGQRAQAPADVHAWGATVGFAARGEPVYGTGSYDTVFSRILRADAALDGIHAGLYPLVAAALLRQPEQRPSAAWLAHEAAGLDLAVPAPPPTSVPLAPAGRGVALKPQMIQSRAPARQEVAYQRPEEVADLLPAVLYAPAPTPAIRPKPPAPRASRRHGLLGLASLVMAVGVSLVLPVAGTLTVAGLLTLLRAGNRARRSLAARRTTHGPRARDPLFLIGSLPWALARSALETALLAPLLLAAATAAVAAATIAAHGAHTLPAWAAIAAAYTTFSCLGPRSRAARRELNQTFTTLGSAPLTAAMTLLTLATLATTIASLILIKTPPLWPLPGLNGEHIHIPGINAAILHG